MHRWNCRIIKCEASDGSVFYKIAEVYYDEDGEPRHYTADELKDFDISASPFAMKDVLKRYQTALDKPVLRWDSELHKLVEVKPIDWSEPDLDDVFQELDEVISWGDDKDVAHFASCMVDSGFKCDDFDFIELFKGEMQADTPWTFMASVQVLNRCAGLSADEIIDEDMDDLRAKFVRQICRE